MTGGGEERERERGEEVSLRVVLDLRDHFNELPCSSASTKQKDGERNVQGQTVQLARIAGTYI